MPTFFSARPLRLGLISLCFLCILFAGRVPAHAQSAPQAVSVAISGDNLTRLLWNNPDGSSSVWKISADGTYTVGSSNGPYSGWTAQALAAGNAPCFFWNNTNGQMSLWNLADTNPSASCLVYGPYSGWSGKALAVGGNNAARLLWDNANGQVSLWNFNDANPSATCLVYGPYSGWSGQAIAAGSDSRLRLLWDNTNGQISLWNLADAHPDQTCLVYGPYSGWSGKALAVGPNNVARMLWVNTSGQVSVWNFADANPSGTCFVYAPPAGYGAVGLAVGADNLVRLLWSDGQGDAQVWTIAASGTYTSVTYPIVPAPVPLYLSNLTLSATAVTGGSGTTGTVTLSGPASADTTVALLSNNSAVTVPPTCTIHAGTTQATFSVTTTAVSAGLIVALSGSYNGWTQGDELSVLTPGSPSGPPPGTSFDVPSIQVAPGNGCAVVDWGRLPAGTVNGYNVYRTSGGTRTLLTSRPSKGNDYPDMGLTNDTATYSYQVSAVDILGQEHALSTPVSITPSSATTTLNWINPLSAVTDNFIMDVSLSSGAQVFGPIFYIDGVQMGGGNSFSRLINGVRTQIAGASFDSSKLSNGPHTVQLTGFVNSNETIACVSPLITIQVSNTISSFHIDNSWFLAQQGELCFVSATAPAGSTWTVQATSEDGSRIIRTWQGASSLVKLAWDGKDASDNLVTLDDYAIQLTVQPSGLSPQAIAPHGTKSTQPVPNAAAASKKTRPIKMQAGQPIALALISIGASYYVDSDGASVATPSADTALSDVLKTSYTTLYGAGNFRIIRSDKFDPGQVNTTVIKNGVRVEITDLDVLKGWLGTAQVFYLFGHGAGSQGFLGPGRTPLSTAFGSIDDTGIHMDFFPTTTVPFDKNNGFYIFVPTYVQGHNYVFAWIDSCNSAGGNSVTGEIGTEDDSWATAFHATTFIGDNGFMIVNNSSIAGPTGLSDWYKWRSDFWANLAKPGQTVTAAYVGCWKLYGGAVGAVNTTQYQGIYGLPPPSTMTYFCTPGDGYGKNPRIVLYGDSFDTTLSL